MKLLSHFAVLTLILAIAARSWAGVTIPKAASRRPLGLPLEKAGVTRVPGFLPITVINIPRGGFGSDTFSRSYLQKKIFEFNVMKFGGGEMGAANGMSADGSIIRDNEQAPDVWVGTTFSLAPLLLSEGMKEEAYHPAWGASSRDLRE